MSNQTILLKIQSSDQTISQSRSNSDFVVNLNNSSVIDQAKGLSVKSVSFINSIDNIPYYWSYFQYYLNTDAGLSAVNTVVIPRGFYNINELMIALEDAINLETPGVGAALTLVDDRVNINTTTPISFYSNDTNRSNFRNPLAESLGFSYHNVNINTVATNHVADGLPTLHGPLQVFLCSRTLGVGNMIDGGSDTDINCLVSIPIDTIYGSLEQYISPDFKSDTVIFKSKRNLGQIDIQIRDDYGYIIELHNQHIVLTCTLIY